nr:hypothetical protein [Cyclonatronum sp.]
MKAIIKSVTRKTEISRGFKMGVILRIPKISRTKKGCLKTGSLFKIKRLKKLLFLKNQIIQGKFAGTYQRKANENDAQLQRIGNFRHERIANANVKHHGNKHGEGKSRSGKPVKQSQHQKNAAQKFGHGSHQSPENRPKGNPQKAHRPTELFPGFRTAHNFGIAVQHNHKTDAYPQKKQAGITKRIVKIVHSKRMIE